MGYPGLGRILGFVIGLDFPKRPDWAPHWKSKAEGRAQEAEGRLNEGRWPGHLQVPRASTCRRTKDDVDKVSSGLIDEWPDWLGLAWLGSSSGELELSKNMVLGLMEVLTAPNGI